MTSEGAALLVPFHQRTHRRRFVGSNDLDDAYLVACPTAG